jgi:6-phosphogluconolactonase
MSVFDRLDRLVIGGYTAELDGNAPGLVVLSPPEPGAGPGARPDVTDVARIAAPSYVIAHPAGPWVFSAGETAPAAVHSFAVDDAGRLTALSALPTGGDFACHLALSTDAGHLLVSNYGSGSVSSFAIGDDGTLSGPLDVLRFTGTGPDPDRQEGPHAHQVLVTGRGPAGDELLVCDLGTDRIHRLGLDDAGRFHRAGGPIELPAGTGPRHAVIVADLLLVACELSSELWVGRRTGDGWEQVQLVATTASTSNPRQPSGIVTDGRTVAVATRGPDTITTFAIGPDGVRRLAEVPSGGAWPRAIELRDRQLWVANQNDGNVTVLDLAEPADPRPLATFAAASATCVLLLPADPS